MVSEEEEPAAVHRHKPVTPPRGSLRLLARLPVHLHRWRAGRLLGSRVLILGHTGRKTGLIRQVALEVVERDRRAGWFLVASGHGPRSQWFRDIAVAPEVTVHHRGRRYDAVAERLSPEEGGQAMARYATRHPRLAKRLMRVRGLTADGTLGGYAAAGRDHIPFVRLLVRTAGDGG